MFLYFYIIFVDKRILNLMFNTRICNAALNGIRMQ